MADLLKDLWEFRPLVSVGPLRFGTPLFDVVRAAGEDPGPSWLYGYGGSTHFTESGVTVYCDPDGLYAVSVDARGGLRVSLAGIELAGQVPSVTEGKLRAYADRIDTTAFELDTKELFLPALGLILRTERVGDAALTRPLLLDRPNELPSADVV